MEWESEEREECVKMTSENRQNLVRKHRGKNRLRKWKEKWVRNSERVGKESNEKK